MQWLKEQWSSFVSQVTVQDKCPSLVGSSAPASHWRPRLAITLPSTVGLQGCSGPGGYVGEREGVSGQGDPLKQIRQKFLESLVLVFHWQVPTLMATPSYKADWKIQSLHVPRKRGKTETVYNCSLRVSLVMKNYELPTICISRSLERYTKHNKM